MILIRTYHKKENISGGFPTSSDNASFIILPACADMSERCDVCACVCSFSLALTGRDSCTRVCGKRRWLLLLLLPPDLCDLLHKDNRAASYPQDPPAQKTARPGSSDRGLPPFELSDRTISTASATTSSFVSLPGFCFEIIESFLIKTGSLHTGNERSALK